VIIKAIPKEEDYNSLIKLANVKKNIKKSIVIAAQKPNSKKIF